VKPCIASLTCTLMQKSFMLEQDSYPLSSILKESHWQILSSRPCNHREFDANVVNIPKCFNCWVKIGEWFYM